MLHSLSPFQQRHIRRCTCFRVVEKNMNKLRCIGSPPAIHGAYFMYCILQSVLNNCVNAVNLSMGSTRLFRIDKLLSTQHEQVLGRNFGPTAWSRGALLCLVGSRAFERFYSFIFFHGLYRIAIMAEICVLNYSVVLITKISFGIRRHWASWMLEGAIRSLEYCEKPIQNRISHSHFIVGFKLSAFPLEHSVKIRVKVSAKLGDVQNRLNATTISGLRPRECQKNNSSGARFRRHCRGTAIPEIAIPLTTLTTLPRTSWTGAATIHRIQYSHDGSLNILLKRVNSKLSQCSQWEVAYRQNLVAEIENEFLHKVRTERNSSLWKNKMLKLQVFFVVVIDEGDAWKWLLFNAQRICFEAIEHKI